jgi:hypothetical protein
VTLIRFHINYYEQNPYNACSWVLIRLLYCVYIISFRSERRLVAVVTVVRMQFPVRQRAAEKDQSVQQPGAAQRGQTLPRVGGA